VARLADAVVVRAVVVTVEMAQHAVQLQLHLLQLRQTPHRIFLPTPMPCLLLRRQRAVVEEVVAAEAAEAAEEVMPLL
jgi:hypothetical protein